MTIEELLAQITNDNQDKCVIDKNLRTIAIPASITLAGVESDDDVNHIPFEMPRYYGAIDLSEFVITINYVNAHAQGDRYLVLDPVVEDDKIYFEWIVGRRACMYIGNVRFIVCLRKFKDDVVDQEFNTTIASLPVLEGLEPDMSGDVEEQRDYIIQVLEELAQTVTVVNNYKTDASTSASNASSSASQAAQSATDAASSAAAAAESARQASHGGIAFDIEPVEDSQNGITSGAVYTVKQELLNLLHPVGSLYFSLESTNPTTLFGGTWERVANGRAIFGVDEEDSSFNTPGKTGGVKSTTHNISGSTDGHVLTLEEIPSHDHGTGSDQYKRFLLTTTKIYDGTCGSLSGTSRVYPYESAGETFGTRERSESVGGGQAHTHDYSFDITVDKLPPYYTCYIWRRVS